MKTLFHQPYAAGRASLLWFEKIAAKFWPDNKSPSR
jgi:hypothetical protein